MSSSGWRKPTPGRESKYAGVDMLYDLNDGLFSELDADAPQIGLYRRDLQRNYLTVLLAATGAVNDPAGPSRGIDSDSVYVDSGSMPVASRRPA